ncbi:hypothetical protein [Sorangium sp. So ce124]|uniref:hypothetical protein n=1 Tax=Sorangium sp. So ce124 TaxID=3133280 RepID=UPI003F5F203F
MKGTMESVVAFVADFDPAFPRYIRGASRAELDELARLAGGPLPAVYEGFLAAMGGDPDWISIRGTRLAIAALTERYRTRSFVPPAEYVLIGVAKDDPYLDLYLHAGAPGGPRVVVFPEGRTEAFDEILRFWLRPVAGSLPEAICTHVVRLLRLNVLPAATRLVARTASAGLLPQVAPLLAPLGLAPLWFSNDWVQVADRGDACVIAAAMDGARLSIEIAAEDTAEVGRITRALSAALPLDEMP